MSLPTQIQDGCGRGNNLKVGELGEILVSNRSEPNKEEDVTAFPFTSFFADSSGATDMRVDGSSTSQEFYIEADDTRDIWIKIVSPFISDNGARLNEFGNLSALTNGLSFTFRNDFLGQITIQDNIQRNLDFYRFCHSTPGLGDGVKAFLLDISGSGGQDSYMPVFDFSVTHGLPWGLRLKKGSKDRISFFVNDDLSSGIDTFDIKAYGVQINGHDA